MGGVFFSLSALCRAETPCMADSAYECIAIRFGCNIVEVTQYRANNLMTCCHLHTSLSSCRCTLFLKEHESVTPMYSL